MDTQPSRVQLTLYYINGQTESFNVYDPVDAGAIRQEIQQEMRRTLDQHWWILHLPEQTVYVNTANILKVEIRPSVNRIQGEGVFPNAERVTALSRAHT
jgi:hypothetical protein